MLGIGTIELLTIFVIALLLLGPKELLNTSKIIARLISDLRCVITEVSKNLDFSFKKEKPTNQVDKIDKA